MTSYKVVAEHDDHLYKIGTIVRLLWAYCSAWGWYVDDEGTMQILHFNEIEEVV